MEKDSTSKIITEEIKKESKKSIKGQEKKNRTGN